ncbi:MAG: hypothetical protein U0800_01815 [Isosphaeraceae bacterium]
MPPPNAGNESQGLKIATIMLSILSFILAITTYFGFSNAANQAELTAKAETDKKAAQDSANAANRAFDTLRTAAGYEKFSAGDADPLQAAITKDRRDLGEKINSIATDVNKAVSDVSAKGGDKSIADTLNLAKETTSLIAGDPNQSLKSLLDRMAVLMKQNTMLTVAMAKDNLAMRTALEEVDSVNDKKVKESEEARDRANATLNDEHNKYEDARKAELAKYEEDRDKLRQTNAKVSQLETDIGQSRETYGREREERMREMSELKDRLAKQDTILDVADGKITYVDYRRNEVRIDVTRNQGVRPQMKFAVFDRGAAGIPSDKPKAMVMITQVTDKDATAQIMTPGNESDKSYMTSHPIYPGDQVYSSVWNPNDPKKIAIVGPIDINRRGHGVDDRADLKRLIEQAGGKVVYDLPPPRKGRESGDPNDLGISMYVLDERPPIFADHAQEDSSEEYKQFEEHKLEIIKKFRESNIPPMTVERLLPMLGYSYGQAKPGQAEAINRGVLDRLKFPQGRGRSAGEANPGSEGNTDQP